MEVPVISIIYIMLTTDFVSTDTTGQVKEICSFETFKPTCDRDEIVQIKHAMYGRMRIGQCVKDDYGLGTIGCETDVRSFLSRKCSGRRTCELYVPIAEVSRKLTCLKEMSPYLEASYICQKVYVPSQPVCTAPLTIQATSRSHYLSSVVTKESSCGLHQTPYVIEAKPGQHIVVTLIDFSVKDDGQDKKCVNYGYILDTGNDDVISLCGGSANIGASYVSEKHQVQILLERAILQNNHFILKYEAKGCPDAIPPKHGWMKHENNTLAMGCLSSPQKWSLRCVGNVWLGIMKNCSPPIAVTQPVVIVQYEDSYKSQQGGIPHMSENHLMAIGIGCVTIIICCVTVVLGIHCVKRYELNVEKKSMYNMNTLNHNINTLYKAVPNGDALMFSTHTEELPTYTLNQEGIVPEVPQRNASVVGGTINMGNNNRDSEIYHSIHRQGSLLG